MEAQEILKKKVGTKEMERKTLTPRTVKIVDIKIETVEKAKSDKVSFLCEHPDRKDSPVAISSVSHIDEREIVTSGTWVNLDEEGNFQKGSAVAKLLQFMKCDTLEDCKGKEVNTEVGDRGYLVIKAY